jgi:hypothetical protein
MIATRFNNSLLMLKAHFRTATRGNRCGLEEVSSDAVVAGPRPDIRAIVQRNVARACWRSSGQAHAIIQRIADYESHRLVASVFALGMHGAARLSRWPAIAAPQTIVAAIRDDGRPPSRHSHSFSLKVPSSKRSLGRR